jgi:hypothetical protein
MVVRREDDGGGAGIASREDARCKGHCGGGVSAVGFDDKVFGRKLRKERTHCRRLIGSGQHQSTLRRYEASEPVERCGKQGAFRKKGKVVFGLGLPGKGPKAFTVPTGKDDCVERGVSDAGRGLRNFRHQRGVWLKVRK